MYILIFRVFSLEQKCALYSGFSLSGGNRYNLPLQATALRTSYRLQPLEGSLKLISCFKKYQSGIVPLPAELGLRENTDTN